MAVYTAPSPSTLGHLLQAQFDARPAIVLPASTGPLAGSFTYAQLRRLIESLQRSLQAGGVKATQRIAMSLPNGMELIAAFLAVTNNSAVAAPLNPAYTTEEVKVSRQRVAAAAAAAAARRKDKALFSVAHCALFFADVV